MVIAFNRYAESNIPVEYWNLEMKDFKGPTELRDSYNKITSDLSLAYNDGLAICFAGGHGVGKTMTTTCMLKKACQKNYLCLYTTLSDIVNALTTPGGEEKFLSRRELIVVDFLAIDEFDSRFMQSNFAADLFGITLEHIFRTRSQNKLPTILCSNSPNPVESFNGAVKQSIESLMSKVDVISILDKDFRKQGK